LVWVAMKARRNRFWICGRLIFWASSTGSHRGIEHGEARVPDAALDAAILQHGGLALDQLLQIIQMRALLLGGFGGEGLVMTLDVRQVQARSCASNRFGSVGVMMFTS